MKEGGQHQFIGVNRSDFCSMKTRCSIKERRITHSFEILFKFFILSLWFSSSHSFNLKYS